MKTYDLPLDSHKRRYHTHFLLSDGTITPIIGKFSKMRVGGTIRFQTLKPLPADMGNGPFEVTFDKPYSNEELEIIGFIKERK